MKPKIYRANEKDYWVLKDGVYVRHLPWVLSYGRTQIRFWTWQEALDYVNGAWCR